MKQMETQAAGGGGGGGCGGGGGGGEVRKVHIVYFLSRNGRIEHPHLIRVHHLSRNGVHLKDVKRWLSELRGKDMPESFSWSYKRKYKAGYVWQDLLDEDLITPISDNEFVLKGSEISSPTFPNVEKEVLLKRNNSPPCEVEVKDVKNRSTRKEVEEDSMGNSRKTSFDIEELPSFGSETSTEDTTKQQDDKSEEGAEHEEEQSQKDKTDNISFYEAFWNKNKGNSKSKNMSTSSQASPSSNYSFGKSSSYSGSGASHMFRNLITCGAVDTNESAVMVINRRKTTLMNVISQKENGKEKTNGRICKGEKLGGSERISGYPWATSDQQHSGRKSYDEQKGYKKSKNGDSNNSKAFSAAYKPVNFPNCSQCGKQFKPEKLHAHMKSCIGMKAFAESRVPNLTTTACKPKISKPDSASRHSFSGCYLTR